MDDLLRWPSLADERAVAGELYGEGGARLLAEWLFEQLARVDDAAFVRTFTDHVQLAGVEPDEYAHRLVSGADGSLLAGIRFYHRDVSRPFVEVVAHTFTDLDALSDCVRAEWSAFNVRYLRTCARPGRLTGPQMVLDVSIHAARYADMAAPDGRVHLQPFTDAEDAIALVDDRYRRLAGDDPVLARNISAADPVDIHRWHDVGQLRAVRAGDRTVGALAVAPDTVSWLSGDVVQEEVIAAAHSGHGYAAAAQTVWAAERAGDRQRLLLGTIDRHNTVSRRTALRAGRPVVLERVFVRL
ncbi:hypothetical protein ACN27E_16935 [Mycobacterium sp. WMMD1722]|uniref:hypothetical protein n=1 Tax=Mycobacterium sp. WMMD1722 TaxID=3404117 RepID=UPI003BF4F90D